MLNESLAEIFGSRCIALELNRRQIPTKKGGAWYGGMVRYLLGNELYLRPQ